MQNNKNIGSKYDSFNDRIQFKGLLNINFFRNIQFKNYSITFFPRKFNSQIYSKI